MQKVNKADFTHYAWFRGVPCYWNESDNSIYGRNWFFNAILWSVAMWVDDAIQILCGIIRPEYEPGFAIRLTGRIQS